MSRAMTPAQRTQFLGMLSNPNAQRWLHIIKYAEGVLKKDNPYGTAFSGKQFDNSKPHPGTVYTSSSGRRSAAHGAYQWMPDTWEEIWGENAPMTKDNQDAAALFKISQRGVDPTSEMSRDSLNRLAPEWASLPKHNGLSYYPQPAKTHKELETVWSEYKPETPKAPEKPRMSPAVWPYTDPNKKNDLQIYDFTTP